MGSTIVKLLLYSFRMERRKQPTLGFAARETAPETFKFQSVIFVASRNGTAMMKTFDPHARLLNEQETQQLGYDTNRLIKQAKEQRVTRRPTIVYWMELFQSEEMSNRNEPSQQPEDQYTIADAETLNSIKNSLRDVTRTLDASEKVYPDSLEASQVKHEIAVLLSELRIHGLLPAEVTIDEESHDEGDYGRTGRT